ncbi:MAG: hypothetical protein ACOYMA_16825 [Bacteroidia bacterium]
MKKLTQILIVSILFFISCGLPKVYFFEAKPYLVAYKEKVDKNITINFGEEIKDTFIINSAGIRKMEVFQFKKSLESSLNSTFKDSYNSMSFSEIKSNDGICLLILKINPDWHKKSAITSVSSVNGHAQSSTRYEIDSKINYQIVVFSNGVKVKVIEKEVYSEKSTFLPKETPDLLKDGIKVMCQELYKEVISIK